MQPAAFGLEERLIGRGHQLFDAVLVIRPSVVISEGKADQPFEMKKRHVPATEKPFEIFMQWLRR